MKIPAGSLLKPLLVHRLTEVKKSMAKLSLGQLQGKIGEAPMTRGFQGALQARWNATGKPAVIAELKTASPFDETFRKVINFKDLAEDFEAVGAAALSVAAERKSYGGSVGDLATVQAAVQIPVLARDIVVDIYQIPEARHAGADALVLSARLLGDDLKPFIERADSVKIDALVEVHTEAELEKALAAGADMICVTSRNIHTFEADPGVFEALLPKIPPGKMAVAEGGLGTREDLERMGALGAKAVIMGTALLSDPDPAGVLERALGIEPQTE